MTDDGLARDDEREQWAITDKGLWLEWRRRDLTASRIAALFDAHSYLTRQQLAEIMRGTTSAGTSSPPDNASMRRGRLFEAAVIAAIEEERPHWVLTRPGTYHRLPALRLGCTPDLFVTSTAADEPGRGLVQIKTASPQKWDQWQARPPLEYLLQTLTELVVTGRDWGVLACMVMSSSYPVHYFPVPRHEKAEARIKAAAAAWWAEFDSGAVPGAAEPNGLAAELDDGSSIDLTKSNRDLVALLDERELLKQSLSVEEKRVKEIDDTLKAALGRARSGWLPNWCITFQTQHRKETIIPAKYIRVLRARRLNDADAADE